MMSKMLLAAAAFVQMATGQFVPLATFDNVKATTQSWETVNDPVMGGQSNSTFHVDADKKLGIWDGEVKIVPFLKAPGFCNLQAPGLNKKANFPNASGTQGIVLVARASAEGLKEFNVRLMTRGAKHLVFYEGSYTANINLTSTMESHFVPYEKFTCTWRGETVKWCPDLRTQLGEIDNVGVGTVFPGSAGKFHVEIQSLAAWMHVRKELIVGGVTGSSQQQYSNTIDLATFNDKGKAPHKWTTEDDPVMGGQSESKFEVKDGYGDYTGMCRIVPKLNAPGFTFAKTEAPLMGSFPDVSKSDGLILGIRNVDSNITKFKFAFCDSRIIPYACQFKTYKADFDLATSDDFSEVFLPWSKFSNKWSSTTGEHTAESPPTASSLSSITQLQLWTEGVAGHFHLQVQYIRAGNVKTAEPSLSALSGNRIDLATFDDKGKAAHSWTTEDDPVMGGKSDSKIEVTNGIADYTGNCRIVPSLNAPGFTFAKTTDIVLSQFPDVSKADGIVLGIRNVDSNITKYKFAFCDSRVNPYTCQLKSYKADFTLTPSTDFTEIFLPWSKFSNKWSPETGEHTEENPPSAATLGSITQLQIWSEGFAGQFHLQVKYIQAGSATKQSQEEVTILV